jgi:hypothetical protein
VRILLKKPFADGTTAVDMDPLSLLRRLHERRSIVRMLRHLGGPTDPP